MTTGGPACQDPWWRRAFAGEYLEIYAHRSDAAAAAEVAGLVPHLTGLQGPLLDAGCGGGRHLQVLRGHGLPALGFDLSPQLLGAARSRPGLAGHLVRADLRAAPFAPGFGAILLLFTSFGYFDDATNASCLAALAELLLPGGKMVVDLPDADHLRSCLVPSSSREVRTAAGSFPLQERRWWDGPRICKEIRYRGHTWQESVRIYRRDEFEALARSSGLQPQACWASLSGADAPGDRQVHWLIPSSAVRAC